MCPLLEPMVFVAQAEEQVSTASIPRATGRGRQRQRQTEAEVTHSMEKQLADKVFDWFTAQLQRTRRYFGFKDSPRGGQCPESGSVPGIGNKGQEVRYLSGRAKEVNVEHRDPRLSNLEPKEVRRRRRQRSVQDLYHCGMVWLHGGHYRFETKAMDEDMDEDMDKDKKGKHESDAFVYVTRVCDWLLEGYEQKHKSGDRRSLRPGRERLKASERSFAAFALALWMADELHVDYPATMSYIPWDLALRPLIQPCIRC